MDGLPVGRRVAYWRKRRNLSQQMFADRLGKSKSWVDKIERGVRKLDKFSVLYEIADVLALDLQLLLGKDPVRRPENINCIDQVDVDEIRSALELFNGAGAFPPAVGEPPSLAELDKSVNYAWQTFQHSKYAVLARTLPTLLRQGQVFDACATGDDAPRAAALLSQIYQIASSALRKLGEHDLAWLAADRAVTVSRRSDDELLQAAATHRVATALVALGRFQSALELNVSMANQLAPDGDRPATPQRLSVYGIMLLQAAMAAARMGDTATVRDLLGAAGEAAGRLPGDSNHYWTSFGPTNVLLHKAAAEIEMGEGGRAVRTHESIVPNRFAGLMPERRAHHLLDLSRGFVQLGEFDKAGASLVRADRLASAEIRCRPIAHEVITDVLRRSRGTPPQAVVELAEQVGVSI